MCACVRGRGRLADVPQSCSSVHAKQSRVQETRSTGFRKVVCTFHALFFGFFSSSSFTLSN